MKDSKSDTYIQNKPTIPSGNQIVGGLINRNNHSSNIPTLTRIPLDRANNLTLHSFQWWNGSTTYENGELLIGNTTGNTLTKATLTAGNNVTITNGTGL